jgi:ABC-type polysaccharide/polyol phosphate export permease
MGVEQPRRSRIASTAVTDHALEEVVATRAPVTTETSAEAEAATRPDSPPPEIWFRRRVRLRSAIRDVWHYRELVLTLAERDLRVRYKQAFLGFAWAIVTPVTLMLLFSLVFTKFAKVDSHGTPYAIFAYVGLLPWTFFSNSLSLGGMSLISNMTIVNKVYCPREVFPLGSILVAAADTAISILVLGVLFPLTGTAPHLESFYAPLLILVLVCFTLGMTLLVSSSLVYLRDLRHALPLIIQLGLFATPVAYSIDVVVHRRSLSLLYAALNPLAPVIDGFRRTVLEGMGPRWDMLGVGAASSVLVLVAGYALFKRLETGIADIA